MAQRRNPAFIGAYISPKLKTALQQQAKTHYRTLSQEITRILEESVGLSEANGSHSDGQNRSAERGRLCAETRILSAK